MITHIFPVEAKLWLTKISLLIQWPLLCLFINLYDNFSSLSNSLISNSVKVFLKFVVTLQIFSVWSTCSPFNGDYRENTLILFRNSLLTDSNKLLHIMYKLMLKIHDCVWHFFNIKKFYKLYYIYFICGAINKKSKHEWSNLTKLFSEFNNEF